MLGVCIGLLIGRLGVVLLVVGVLVRRRLLLKCLLLGVGIGLK